MSTITTKEQERTALRKITEILGTLEPGSYVRMAITENVLRMAADNIEFDFGNSPDDQIEYWQKTAADYREELFAAKEKAHKLEIDIANMQGEIWQAEEKLQKMKDEADADYCTVAEERDALEDQLAREKEACAQADAEALAMENKAAQLESENFRLKARLYDLLIAENKEA